MAPFASFIIPTLGRDSLWQTCISLVEQTDEDWEALVVIDPKAEIDGDLRYIDERIKYLHVTSGAMKKQLYGSAGLLRNYAVHDAQGEWIAFVDDDDTLEPAYIEHLRQHSEDYPQADVVIFRMLHPKFGVLPRKELPLIEHGQVGISFAIKHKVALQYPFNTGDAQAPIPDDIDLLKRLKGAGYEMYISPHVDYMVGE